MNSTSFLIWFGFIAFIAAVGIGAMVQAYVGAGSLAVLFPDPIALSPDSAISTPDAVAPDAVTPGAATQFQQGLEAYRLGQYHKAVEQFSRVIQLSDTLAEAHHNRGLAIANLRQDGEAARTLLNAGELYLQQGNLAGFNQVKQDLEILKARKPASSAEKTAQRSQV